MGGFSGSGDAWAYCRHSKGRPAGNKPPEETKRQGSTGAGEEEA